MEGFSVNQNVKDVEIESETVLIFAEERELYT